VIGNMDQGNEAMLELELFYQTGIVDCGNHWVPRTTCNADAICRMHKLLRSAPSFPDYTTYVNSGDGLRISHDPVHEFYSLFIS